jgi:hypothetical protein
MQVDGRLSTGQRQGDVVIHSMFMPLFEGRMFSRWTVTNITSARRTLHCLKTRIPFGDQLLICGL